MPLSRLLRFARPLCALLPLVVGKDNSNYAVRGFAALLPKFPLRETSHSCNVVGRHFGLIDLKFSVR